VAPELKTVSDSMLVLGLEAEWAGDGGAIDVDDLELGEKFRAEEPSSRVPSSVLRQQFRPFKHRNQAC
jgi:hypothetical protein